MPSKLKRKLSSNLLVFAVLLYAAISIAFGGSGRDGVYVHGILQGSTAVAIALLVATWPVQHTLGHFRTPITLLVSYSVIGVLQCVPLPVAVWQLLPGREVIVEGHASLDLAMTAMPISLDVQATAATVGYVFPVIFVLLVCARIGIDRLREAMPWFLVCLGVVSVLLGFAQIVEGRESQLYFYEFTNRGLPVGPFANVNHYASFALMILPFAFYLLSESSKKWKESDLHLSLMIASFASLLTMFVGIVSAGSLAVYIITTPIIILTSIVVAPQKRAISTLLLRSVLVVGLLLSIVLVATSPMLKNLGITNIADGPTSRYQIWQNTIDAIRANWMSGTGIGTFQSVIPMFEDRDAVTSTYVARAHNEYLQILMELGVFGAVMIVVGGFWFVRRVWEVWGAEGRGKSITLRKVASISLFVALLHSVVDFPARTPAIATIFALILALICLPDSKPRAPKIKVEDNPKRVVL